MRTVERPCRVTVQNGAVVLECDGAVAVFDPAAAEQASSHFLALAASVADLGDHKGFGRFASETGGRLADCAAAIVAQQRRVAA